MSGKGGTGKTMLTASFVSLASPVMAVDCDIDAPNLHLLLHPRETRSREFQARRVAERNLDACTGCGRCAEVCRFEAITVDAVLERACEGCGFCVAVCATGALRLISALTGHILESTTRYGPMVHARLAPGGEGSGKLVTEVRERACRRAADEGIGLVLIDGPPGIGCAAIAAVVGADLVVVVAEPTVAGVHDLARILDLGQRLGLAVGVVLNKSDLSQAGADAVRRLCADASAPLLAELPYDETVAWAITEALPPVELCQGPITDAIRSLWDRILAELDGEGTALS